VVAHLSIRRSEAIGGGHDALAALSGESDYEICVFQFNSPGQRLFSGLWAHGARGESINELEFHEAD